MSHSNTEAQLGVEANHPILYCMREEAEAREGQAAVQATQQSRESLQEGRLQALLRPRSWRHKEVSCSTLPLSDLHVSSLKLREVKQPA